MRIKWGRKTREKEAIYQKFCNGNVTNTGSNNMVATFFSFSVTIGRNEHSKCIVLSSHSVFNTQQICEVNDLYYMQVWLSILKCTNSYGTKTVRTDQWYISDISFNEKGKKVWLV